MPRSHNDYLRRAIQLAVANVEDGGGGPFGAVVVREGRILAEGANRVVPANDPTAHAEVVAIREACRILNRFQLDDCAIYTSCEPCPMCLGAIYWARLREIYFAACREDAAAAGFDDSLIYSEIPLAPSERRIGMRHLACPDAAAPFRAWIGKRDRIPY
jgi:guanine deaminase